MAGCRRIAGPPVGFEKRVVRLPRAFSRLPRSAGIHAQMAHLQWLAHPQHHRASGRLRGSALEVLYQAGWQAECGERSEKEEPPLIIVIGLSWPRFLAKM